MKKIEVICVYILVLAFFLSSCKSSAPEPNPTNQTEKQLITVTISNNEAITTLDDFDNFATVNKKLCNVWADTLIESDHKGGYTPWLATDWTWSSDNLHCMVHIRKGVRFQNGEPLTSKDVKLTFDRIITDKTLSNSIRWSQKLVSVDTPDDYTAVLNFKEPMPNFNAEAATVPIICASEYNLNPRDFFIKPVASGPYRVVSTDFKNSIVIFERWDEWWGWTSENKSNVDRVIYKQISEVPTRVYSVETGQIDIAENLPIESIDTIENAGCLVYSMPYYQNVFIALNCHTDSIFADERVREALSKCIDRHLIIDSVIGGGFVSTWPMPRGVISYKVDSAEYDYDVEKAKTLLQETEYKGEPLNMIIPSSKILRGAELSLAIQSMAAQAGFNIKISTLSNDIYDKEKFSGRYDLCLCNFSYMQGESFIPMMEVLRPSYDVFNTGYRNQQLEDLITKASTIVDINQRIPIEEQAYQIVIDHYAPNIYLYDEEYAVGTVRNLNNFTLYPDGLMELRYLRKN